MPTFNLARIRLAAEFLLIAACSFLYNWGSHAVSQRAESESKVQMLAQQMQTLSDAKRETEHDTKVTLHTVTKPDGTKDVTETRERVTLHETEQQHEQVQTQVQTEQQTHSSVPLVGTASLSRYSLELEWAPLQPGVVPYIPEAAHVGARLGDLPLWLTGGVEHPDTRFIPVLGLRYEF